MRILTIVLSFIFSLTLFTNSFGQDLYKSIIVNTHQATFNQVTNLAKEISKETRTELRNDLTIAIAYAYFATFKYDSCLSLLSNLQSLNNSQSGSVHQIKGLYYIIGLKYNSAASEFSKAMSEYHSAKNETAFYEAMNNLANAMILEGSNQNETNLIIDRVINYCEQSKDSVLLSYALLNKALAYPSNGESFIHKTNSSKIKSFASTSYFVQGIINNDRNSLMRALELNSYVSYNQPAPLKISERALTILKLASLQRNEKSNVVLKLLKEEIKDSLFLSPALTNQILKELSNYHYSKGSFDSSAMFLLKIKSSDAKGGDTLKNNAPIILKNISEQDETKEILLWASIGMISITLVLSYFLFRAFFTSNV